MADDSITMFDPEGREVSVPRTQWIEEILPENLRYAWDNPEALYAVLLAALNEKMGPHVLEAIHHLAEIDPNAERPVVLEGTAMMQDNRPDDAERLFQTYIDNHGPTASLLTNLARIYWDRGQRAQADATLRKAIKIDANLDGLLHWFVSIQRQRGGDVAAQSVLEQLAEEPRNWRARIWIAAVKLKQGRTDEAMALYQKVLSAGELPPEAMVQITADLGSAGKLIELADVVLPFYHVKMHGPYAGVNLLQALMALRRTDQAETLMAELEELKHPVLSKMLAGLTARASKSNSPAPAAPAQSETSAEKMTETELSAIPLLNPVWTAALRKPDWILPPLPAATIKVAIFSLADMTQAAGALTRTLPLYWAESLRLRSAAATLCVVPALRRAGPVAIGEPWPLPHMLATCPPEFTPDFVVCGAMKTGSRGNRIELHVFRVSDKQPIKTLRIPAAADFTGAAEAGERELVACLAQFGAVASDNSVLSPPQSLDAYLNCIGHLLLLTMAASNLIDPGRMPDERQMLDTIFNLADAEAKSPLPAILAFAAIAAVAMRGSSVVESYKQRTLDLLHKQGQSRDVIRRLAPVVLKRLGETETFNTEYAALRPTATDSYALWMDTILT